MTRKALNIFVELNVHAVTCPGVWLDQHGKVMLRVTMLDTTVRTSRLPPVFPLLFHSKFIFQKALWDVCRLPDLEKALANETLLAQLIQSGKQEKLLAAFETSLLELLYPVPYRQDLLCGVDIDLLMESAPSFPGILAPKIEVSTKTTIEEVTKNARQCKFVINPKMLSSKVNYQGRNAGPLRGQSSSQPRYDTRHSRCRPPSFGATRRTPEAPRYSLDDSCHCPTGRSDARLSACRDHFTHGPCQVCRAYNKYFNPPATQLPQPLKKTLESSSSGSSQVCESPQVTGLSTQQRSSGCHCPTADRLHTVPSLCSSGREVFYRDLERFYSKLHRRYQARSSGNLACS